jgi:hypothetical protein
MITDIQTKHPVTKCIGRTAKGLDLFQVKKPWEIKYRWFEELRHITCPIDYVYDGASIPRIAWSILGLYPGGVMELCSLPHDIPYRAEGGKNKAGLMGCKIMNENGNTIYITRKEVDLLFRELMLEVYISKRKANLCYGVVRLIGGRHWGGPCPAGMI